MNIAKHKTYRILIRIAVACLLLMVRHDAYAGTREAEPMMLEADSVVVGEKAEAADSVRGAVHESVPVMADGRLMRLNMRKAVNNIYTQPYSLTGRCPDWHRMWINTAVLSGAFVGTLLVLECLPEDATSWNRAELQDVPLFKRWWNHVARKGPEWDHDNPVFNYVLHPYAGAVYFMSARSCGFNAWQSLLYCTLISNVGWEFGIVAFMERPSIQDLFITPLVGSVIGEAFYRAKRGIVRNGYRLLGSKVLGTVACFLMDPVNEVVDLFRGSRTRGLYTPMFESSLGASVTPQGGMVTLSLRF